MQKRLIAIKNSPSRESPVYVLSMTWISLWLAQRHVLEFKGAFLY